MAGYRGDAVPRMQKRMIEAMESIPGVTSVGLVDNLPLSDGGYSTTNVYTGETVDLRPAKCQNSNSSLPDLSQLLSGGRHNLSGGPGILMAR